MQVALYRSMTPEKRGESAWLMSEDRREIARTGIRLRHPDYTETQVAQALVELLYGEAVARSIWPER